MKSTKKSVEQKLWSKRIAIIDQIDRLRKLANMTDGELAEKMGVNKSYLSRVLHGPQRNITLETIAKCEEALERDILVTPHSHEESLLDNTERLFYILVTAFDEHPEFYDKVACEVDARRMKIQQSETSDVVAPSHSRQVHLHCRDAGAGARVIMNPKFDSLVWQAESAGFNKAVRKSATRRKVGRTHAQGH